MYRVYVKGMERERGRVMKIPDVLKVKGVNRLMFKNGTMESIKGKNGTFKIEVTYETTKLYDIYLETIRLTYAFIEMFK